MIDAKSRHPNDDPVCQSGTSIIADQTSLPIVSPRTVDSNQPKAGTHGSGSVPARTGNQQSPVQRTR